MSKLIQFIQLLVLSITFFVAYGAQAASTVTFRETFKEVLEECEEEDTFVHGESDVDGDGDIDIDDIEQVESEVVCEIDSTGTYSIVANIDLSATGISFTDLSEDTSVTLIAENFFFSTSLGEAENYTSGDKKAIFVVTLEDDEEEEKIATIRMRATKTGVIINISGKVNDDNSELGLGVLALNFLEGEAEKITDEPMTLTFTLEDPILGEVSTTIDVTAQGKRKQKTTTVSEQEYTLNTITLSGKGKSSE